MAVNLLAKAGFNSVFNGQRLVNGWKNSGLPWTYDINPDRMLLPPVVE